MIEGEGKRKASLDSGSMVTVWATVRKKREQVKVKIKIKNEIKEEVEEDMTEAPLSEKSYRRQELG
jgi:hypothetical protein